MALVFHIRPPETRLGLNFVTAHVSCSLVFTILITDPSIVAWSQIKLNFGVQDIQRASHVHEHFPNHTPRPPKMSIIQSHTTASLSDNWRTINIDALDPESSQNFDITTLHSALPEVSEAEVRQLAGQVRQLLRGGDAEGALRGACESAPVGASDAAKVCLSV
jgi:hypothetical protein